MKGIIFIALLIMMLVNMASAEQINISKLTLQEKVAQMVIVKGDNFDSRYLELGVGGIQLDKQKTKEDYQRLINRYQKNSEIKLFVATDMEGYWNPFTDFYKSKNFAQIKNGKEAYELGKEHGKILKEIGFNFDFSPVAEVRNKVWPGRSFTGSQEEVKEKIKGYIKGLQEQGILATAKHYPGGSLIKDPHIFKIKSEIYDSDLELFNHAIENDVDTVMIGHTIAYGAIDSKGKQSTVSPDVIGKLRDKFDGLIITDAITMWGLRWSYLFTFNKKVYVDAINAGNDIILDVWHYSGYKRVEKRINNVVEAVEKVDISEDRIDESVRRILKIKGYEVVY